MASVSVRLPVAIQLEELVYVTSYSQKSSKSLKSVHMVAQFDFGEHCQSNSFLTAKVR